MKAPELKSTVVAMAIGAALTYAYFQYKNSSIAITDPTTALLVGGIFGGILQVVIRLTGVS